MAQLNRVSQVFMGIITIALGVRFAASIMPGAISDFVAVDTSSWDSGTASMWDLTPMVAVLGLIILFLGVAFSVGRKVRT